MDEVRVGIDYDPRAVGGPSDRQVAAKVLQQGCGVGVQGLDDCVASPVEGDGGQQAVLDEVRVGIDYDPRAVGVPSDRQAAAKVLQQWEGRGVREQGHPRGSPDQGEGGQQAVLDEVRVGIDYDPRAVGVPSDRQAAAKALQQRRGVAVQGLKVRVVSPVEGDGGQQAVLDEVRVGIDYDPRAVGVPSDRQAAAKVLQQRCGVVIQGLDHRVVSPVEGDGGQQAVLDEVRVGIDYDPKPVGVPSNRQAAAKVLQQRCGVVFQGLVFLVGCPAEGDGGQQAVLDEFRVGIDYDPRAVGVPSNRQAAAKTLQQRHGVAVQRLHHRIVSR